MLLIVTVTLLLLSNSSGFLSLSFTCSPPQFSEVELQPGFPLLLWLWSPEVSRQNSHIAIFSDGCLCHLSVDQSNVPGSHFSLCNYINITPNILVKLWTCSWATQWWTAEGAPRRSSFSWALSLLPPANLWETASGHWTRWPALRAQLAAEATPCRLCGQGTAASPYWSESSWSGRSRTTLCRYPWLATGSGCLKKCRVQKSLCFSIILDSNRGWITLISNTLGNIIPSNPQGFEHCSKAVQSKSCDCKL